MFIREYLRKNHLDDRVAFRGIRCMGQCTNGPNLMINGRIVENVSLQAIEGILDRELSRLK
jgi:NADH:ubiquinone oxidoreductase subunit E